jgi:hypothetical protein
MPTVSKSIAEMELPAVGGARALMIGYAIYLGLTSIAIFNVIRFCETPRYALVASIIFLFIAAFGFWCTLHYEGGFKGLFVHFLGHFSSQHFTEIVSLELVSTDDTPSDRLRFGFVLREKAYYYVELPCSSVSSVEWSTGQASDRVGRDMNDWHVILWYHDTTGAKRLDPDLRSEEVYIVGRFGPRAEVETLGNRFVEFLRSANVAIHRTEYDTEYSSTGKSKSLRRPENRASTSLVSQENTVLHLVAAGKHPYRPRARMAWT